MKLTNNYYKLFTVRLISIIILILLVWCLDISEYRLSGKKEELSVDKVVAEGDEGVTVGDFVMTGDASYQSYDPATGVLTILDGANLTENAVKLVLRNDNINKTYLSRYLGTPYAQKYIKQRKLSVGVPKLAIFRIQEIPLVIPPIELQNQFAEIVENIEKQKALLNESLVELENNFNSLMQRAFKGESLY